MEVGSKLSLDENSMCNCLKAWGSKAHSEQYLTWLEFGGGEGGNKGKGLERREVERDDIQ